MDDQPQDSIDPTQAPGVLQGIENLVQPVANAVENTAAARIGSIQMVSVQSSDILEWGYDPVGFRIQIHFTNDRMYVYENVSPLDFEALSAAPSKGKAFWAMIRRDPVGHPFTRLQLPG